MEFKFRKPTEIDGNNISAWKYEGVYSFYDNDKTEQKKNWALNIHKEDDTFIIYSDKDELIANCNFTHDEDGILFGIQMRPNLTGKGMGTKIVSAALEFGRDRYNFNYINLLVAKFNKRAIKIYDKLEFEFVEEFVWKVNDEEREFIEMKKIWSI